MAIRFGEEEVRPMGLVAAGVMGIKLKKGDEVIGMGLLPRRGSVFMIASDGSAKRVATKNFPSQGRYGQGVVAWKLPAKVKAVGMTIGKGTARLTLHLNELAPKSTRLDDAPSLGRTARGKVIQELKKGDRITKLTVPLEMNEEIRKPAEKPAKASAKSDGRGAKRKTSKKSSASKKTSSRKRKKK
ncbi:MAG: DNA gyrase C-terminal beta-propeller domain-containing protein [Anaerolineales bacterium]